MLSPVLLFWQFGSCKQPGGFYSPLPEAALQEASASPSPAAGLRLHLSYFVDFLSASPTRNSAAKNLLSLPLSVSLSH